jgi:O-antigen/teichoic acid export membrane protein
MSLGHTRLLLKATCIAAVGEIILLYPVLRRFGIEGVAVLVTVSYAVQYLVYFPSLKRELGLKFGEVYSCLQAAISSSIIILLLDKLLVMSDVLRLPAGHLWLKLFVSAASFFLVHGLISRWRILREARSLIWGT